MRKVHISEVKSGDMLAVDIFGVNGAILLSKGVKLTDPYIHALRQKGIQYLYIDDRYTFDITAWPMLNSTIRKQAVKKVYETMTSLINEKSFMKRVSSFDLGKAYQHIFKQILEDVLNRQELMIQLSDLVVSNGYFFHHAVNVATIAAVIGLAKGYRTEQLFDLGIGALLFDIGMTQIPEELWRKKGFLTPDERAMLHQHTILGFHMLKDQDNISLASAYCALQHHERYDGSGYPRGIKGKEIHEYAKIVAIADVFDALISARYHRKQYSPHEAAEYLSAAGNILFDYELIKTFLSHVAIYPVATTVVLNTGYTGVVAKVFPDFPLRPIVRIIQDPYGEELKSPYEIDLRTEMNVTIVKAV
ncbi:MAG: HD-GYP domain-containing protein [Anoxybacillus sp.]|nr:HD-GYP domain-containing protein [Anoxybacillus sp.]MCL6588148.1 HD-GYP domain-containing protein [Anoxybacillus sp.]